MAKRLPPAFGKHKRLTTPNEEGADKATGQSGLVTRNYGQTLDVEDPDGNIHRCTVRKKIQNLVCGDKVFWLPAGKGEGVIVALQPRRTLLVRPDSKGALKPVAANVDQLLVVIAPRSADDRRYAKDKELLAETSLIDRYLVAAELSRIQPIIVINKIDLLEAEILARIRLYMETYEEIGYEVLYTSTKQPVGIDELTKAFEGHINVFCGPSGVGKSSLVKTILPEQDIRIGEVSAASGAGRHTTTLTALYHLTGGGALIDSPGVRDFGMWHVGAEQIGRGFVEFQEHAAKCRFANCTHIGEPGCAVQEAVLAEEISSARLASYRRIVASLQH